MFGAAEGDQDLPSLDQYDVRDFAFGYKTRIIQESID